MARLSNARDKFEDFMFFIVCIKRFMMLFIALNKKKNNVCGRMWKIVLD